MDKQVKRNRNLKSVLESEYTPFLIEALNKIDGSYYRLMTTYGEVVRERVFCYEFYHQMRLAQRNHNLVKLHPEIDKSGHRKFKSEHRKNPDFIFHIPGQMKGNQVIIEVKGKVSNDIFKDFDTLSTFCENYYYKVGYFILFGNDLLSLIDFLKEEGNVEKLTQYVKSTQITVICKENVQSVTEVMRLSTLIELIK